MAAQCGTKGRPRHSIDRSAPALGSIDPFMADQRIKLALKIHIDALSKLTKREDPKMYAGALESASSVARAPFSHRARPPAAVARPRAFQLRAFHLH